MVSPLTHATDRVVGFMDIGTNSVRLLLVRVNSNHSYTIITQQREAVRLGEGEFTRRHLQPEAMQRAELVCRKFTELAHSFGAEAIYAVATAATREAQNQAEFLQMLQRNERLDVRVISGLEEARLIHIGVSSGIDLGKKKALFIDIGGGSTELVVGGQREYDYLDSLRLGAIRLTMLYLHGETGTISATKYQEMRAHVRDTAVRAMQHLREAKVKQAIGSSGTIETLAAIAARAYLGREPRQDDTLTFPNLEKVVVMLCALPLEERRKVPGLNPERADIIIGGAAILHTLMEDLALPEISVSRRGLREGMVVDYLSRSEYAHLFTELSVRERSVLQLGRHCAFDETHARTVTRLAVELFDSAREAGAHNLGDDQRELLHYTALLHDIGMFIAFSNHHAHSHYLISNAELLGFDQKEQSIMAAAAFFHRKPLARRKYPAFITLDDESQAATRVLAMLLRLAESLDRSHQGIIQSARLRADAKNRLVLELRASQDCQLEIWGVQRHQEAFNKIFGVKLGITVEITGGL